MKCTLRKVENDIVATVDERPKVDEWSYNTLGKFIWFNNFDITTKYEDKRIIASTIIGVGMELWVDDTSGIKGSTLSKIDALIEYIIDFNTEYEYTIEDNKLIIKL